MSVWNLCLVFTFVSSALGEDTVAGDVGAHQLERLVEMLTPMECEDLLFALSHPEENIFKHLERLSPERNTLGLDARAKRDASLSVEVGKNINQDKALSLKRFVDDYHKYVSSLNVAAARPDAKQRADAGHRVRKRRVEDLTRRDLDLIVEQASLPPYQKGPLDVARPLFYGVLLGFGGTLIAGVAILLIVLAVPGRSAPTGHGQGLKKQ
ncbi:transmembrane and death domain protein 1-like isoform X2 [Scophthalmus maximus]|uniref:transmembrane and death domain protein 1-like isoform X2 n=1 Tax=Scophthalmus maximus TaxID=52904 RepID=UPI001FA90629|nr:transmembrane and death domain protein 1-like isoform X2 [Scophthalmus maximus]